MENRMKPKNAQSTDERLLLVETELVKVSGGSATKVGDCPKNLNKEHLWINNPLEPGKKQCLYCKMLVPASLIASMGK